MNSPTGNTKRLLLVLTAGLLLSACSTLSADTDTQTDQPPAVSYLEETVPPCTPIEETQNDPCEPGAVTPVRLYSIESAAIRLSDDQPDFVDMFMGGSGSLSVPHVVIRGTVQPDSARCEVYPVVPANFLRYRPSLANDWYWYCFSDVTVNEYIVGTGPPAVTAIMHVESISAQVGLDWENERADYVIAFGDPERGRRLRTRVAN